MLLNIFERTFLYVANKHTFIALEKRKTSTPQYTVRCFFTDATHQVDLFGKFNFTDSAKANTCENCELPFMCLQQTLLMTLGNNFIYI